MAANGNFPPVTYSSLFVPYLLQASKSGDNKAAEIAAVLQQKKQSLTGGNNKKKGPKKRWKQLAKNAFCTDKVENGPKGTNGDCQFLDGQGYSYFDPEELTLLQRLALNALELTAPASDILLKNRSNNWVQLSGHEGAFAPAGPGTLWKKRPPDDCEVQSYEALVKDIMSDMIPNFYRDVEYNGDYFIEMQDLLHNFKNPAVMDIKMGTRTFLESEVQNTKARTDLYEKMIKVDPNAPTLEEQEAKAITKLRYMLFRETLSSSSTLGFRIEGFRANDIHASTKDLKLATTKEREDVIKLMKFFMGNNNDVCEQLTNRLKLLRSKFEQSAFFKNHEVIGSSLLIIYDDTAAGAWMIDFAKTLLLPQDITIDHRSPWVLGNHEDGYLLGLDNLISVLEDCKV